LQGCPKLDEQLFESQSINQLIGLLID